MRILFLDDDEQRHEQMRRMSVGHDVSYAWTANEAIAALHERFDLLCLDHDLGGKTFVPSEEPDTGYQVAKAVSALDAPIRPRRVFVHSFNPVGAKRMVDKLRDAGVKAIHAPFGTWRIG